MNPSNNHFKIKTCLFLVMNDLAITDEQEAAVAILFASVMGNGKPLTQSQIEQLSRMLVLCSKFKSASLNELTVKALSLQATYGSKTIIEQSAPLVSADFRETVFAMCCEILTADGKVDETESEILAMTALYLGMSIENMKMMLTTYLIRNRWNVQIIEQ
jgi:uncharacterized tellurite resistance protein B-like protein